jgi:hypothetical protein
MLVCVPLTAGELRRWANGEALSRRLGAAVTPTMMEAFGFAAVDDEEAEHTALNVAGLASLIAYGSRLVAVVEQDAEDLADEFGGVSVEAIPFSALTSLFTDPAGVVAPELSADGLAACWEDDAVQEFLSENELLWFGPSEWESITR